MHAEASEWVGRFADPGPLGVLDIGGRDINGTCRAHFPGSVYVSLDVRPGRAVDIVADAATWIPDRQFDIVLCAEVFEHTPDWPAIVRTAFAACRPGGLFVVTCAGEGRFQHSAVDGGDLYPGEHYRNVTVPDLVDVLLDAGFVQVVGDRLGTDTRASARRPE